MPFFAMISSCAVGVVFKVDIGGVHNAFTLFTRARVGQYIRVGQGSTLNDVCLIETSTRVHRGSINFSTIWCYKCVVGYVIGCLGVQGEHGTHLRCLGDLEITIGNCRPTLVKGPLDRDIKVPPATHNAVSMGTIKLCFR